MAQRTNDELLVITKMYDFILWSCNHTGNGFRVAGTLQQDICSVVPELISCPVSEFPGGVCLSVKSRSSSRVGLLFVSLTHRRSAQYKTDPAGLPRRKARTPRRVIFWPYPASTGVVRRIKPCGDECHNCSHIDGEPGTFSGHDRDRQNPDNLAKLATYIPVPLLTQD